MNKLQVIDLLEMLKRSYPGIDTSPESVQHYCKYLQDFPFDVAMRNVEEHIRTERFPPTIADIRGRLGDQMDAERSRRQAQEYFDQLEEWRKRSAPPPPGLSAEVRAMLRGDRE
jgi:hypothetical protein